MEQSQYRLFRMFNATRARLNRLRALNDDFSFTIFLTDQSRARLLWPKEISYRRLRIQLRLFVVVVVNRDSFRFLSERCAVRRISSVVLAWARPGTYIYIYTYIPHIYLHICTTTNIFCCSLKQIDSFKFHAGRCNTTHVLPFSKMYFPSLQIKLVE